MIRMEELEELQKYLESTQIEDDFRFGSEKERITLLELLEKIMDLGDRADEVATRLIFKGKLPVMDHH